MPLNDDLDLRPLPPGRPGGPPRPTGGHTRGRRTGLPLCPRRRPAPGADGSFGVGGAAYRDIKAAGDLGERLRTTAALLRRSLLGQHFEGDERVECVVAEAVKAYAGRLPGLHGEVFFLPGVGGRARPPALDLRAVRVVRRITVA